MVPIYRSGADVNSSTKMNIPYTRRSRVAFSRNAASTTKCRTLLCFSRFYPAYFRNRYRSRTGKVSEY